MVNYIQKEGIFQPEAGEAYAFFDCNAPKQLIDAYLQGRLPDDGLCLHDDPKPHELGLELRLDEVKEFARRGDVDPKLLETISREPVWAAYPEKYGYLKSSAKPKLVRDLRYVVTARGAESNEAAGSALVTVMNDIYLKFGNNEPFTSAILGKGESGEYYLWEEE